MQQDDDVLLFVQTWAEAVIRQLDRVRKQREKDVTDVRNYERMEDWSPTEEDLRRNFRVRWAEEHTLIWAAHQLEQWNRRLAVERGAEPPEPDEVLARVRNALEHLDEADFEEGQAVPGPLGGNRSLRSLPGGRLALALGFFDSPFAGLISPTDLEKRALAVVQRIEAELDAEIQDAVERYLSLMSD